MPYRAHLDASLCCAGCHAGFWERCRINGRCQEVRQVQLLLQAAVRARVVDRSYETHGGVSGASCSSCWVSLQKQQQEGGDAARVAGLDVLAVCGMTGRVLKGPMHC
jgi:hypothetical protein